MTRCWRESRRNPGMTRGENWLDASWMETSVIANTTPAT
jgi:hypothetical protein